MIIQTTVSLKEGDSLEVAVKLFEQLDDLLPNTAAELTRSYSDMRFELNKLSTLSHPYIVKFIGVLTNPHSFVLEWAPLKSLEHIRQQHAKEKEPFCPMSIAKVLMQVCYNDIIISELCCICLGKTNTASSFMIMYIVL